MKNSMSLTILQAYRNRGRHLRCPQDHPCSDKVPQVPVVSGHPRPQVHYGCAENTTDRTNAIQLTQDGCLRRHQRPSLPMNLHLQRDGRPLHQIGVHIGGIQTLQTIIPAESVALYNSSKKHQPGLDHDQHQKNGLQPTPTNVFPSLRSSSATALISSRRCCM